MKLTTSALAIFALTISVTASAGMPVDEDMTCPIGDETFKTTSTMSCTKFGNTMSLQPITSCDFITRLPQCPTNKLPLYKEFSTDDLAKIETFMETRAYKDAATGSRYFLAALIESKLTSRQSETEFYVLQEGFWHTPAQSYDKPDYLAAYHKAASEVYALEEFESKPFWRGAEAMVYLAEGNNKAAKKNIKLMETDDKESKDFLKNYKKALTYCARHPKNKDLCTPTSALSSHKK